MQIIPVVDLKAGNVVRARQGNRDQYSPIQSPLCQSSRPQEVVASLLALYPFEQCYIADLDAIGGSGGHHESVITELLSLYPEVEFMTDCGYRYDFFTRHYTSNHIPVLGSESLNSAQLTELAENRRKRFILSLDFAVDRQLGPATLFKDDNLWPDDIIIMSLASVGSLRGPAYSLMQKYRQINPSKHLIAAGGVRNLNDLLQLKELGISAVLIASALHSGAITGQDILKIS